LFEAAINNLLDIHNRLRFNNFSYAMRELLGHILKRLAPDECVKKCVWYTPPASEREVVRSRRIKYAIQKGLSDNFILEELGIVKKYSELEEYATHAYWRDYEIEAVELEDTDYEKLQIRVSGIIEPEFQIGSDSDVKEGNGMVFTRRIPFVAYLVSSIENPYELQVEEFNMDIDNTRDFWEDIRILED